MLSSLAVRRAFVFVCLFSCGLFPDVGDLVGGDSAADVGAGDAIVDAAPDASADAAGDAGLGCDPKKAFGVPQLVAVSGNGAVDTENARLDTSEKEIFFQQYASNYSYVLDATRTSTTAAFGAATAIPSIDTTPTADNWDQMLGADDLTLVFSSDRDGPDHLFITTRPNPSGAFGAPSPIAAINATSYGGSKPYIQGQNIALWYTSGPNGNGDIYVAQPDGNGSYALGAPVVEINTTADEGFPVVSADGLVIYFFRDDPDAGQNEDIWTATRASTTAPFDTPTRVDELATPQDDDPSWLSPDLCRLYLTNDTTGHTAVYVASRTP
jgi:hypothetical protein